ncbi:hypothetical protein FRC17_001518 [Serendipita sp. 399]|nr:hypothetical protein FRC17_001518 [Serendipita sp. 399]
MTNETRTLREEMAMLRQLVGDFEEQGWEKAWQINVRPWDKLGAAQPPLQSLLQSDEQDWPRAGRALVPGCGKGYDAIFIASTLGLDTLAIDISTTAVKAANDLLASTRHLSSGKVAFQEADFFTLSVGEEPVFDLIYDYTRVYTGDRFFVAIPPARRPEWGRRMNELIKSGGFLITLIYPINPPREDGPPFFIDKSHYIEVLGDGWEKVIERVPEDSIDSHVGLEYLIVWKKL